MGVIAGLAACGSSTKAANSSGTKDAATVASAADLGGLDALIAAAKKEGALNVITLPPDWANYGEIIDTFSKKYGIKVNSDNPDGSSQDEINAVKSLKGQGRAPDVLDLGGAFAQSAAKEGLLPGGDLGRHPRRRQGRGRCLVLRLRRLRLDRLRRQEDHGLPPDVRGPAEAGVQGQGGAQR
jgi:ABC-type glycerol-3-phosphate transport system substrate-binding protein